MAQNAPVHVVVATPCFGGMVGQLYMQSVIALLQHAPRAGIAVSIELLGHDSLITRSRNALVARVLDLPHATHLLFVDADIGFGTDQPMRMLHFNEDIVAGMYPLKLRDWHHTHGQTEPPDSATLRYVGAPCAAGAALARDGFIPADYAGTGFMLIRRTALETMMSAYPNLRYRAAHTTATPSRSPHQFALFDSMIDPDTGEYLSEDYTFCHRWRALGGHIWLDTLGELTHVGAHDFRGRPAMRAIAG